MIGHGIASNLRKKLPATTTVHINDVSDSICQTFKESYSQYGQVVIHSSPKSLMESGRPDVLLSSLPSTAIVRKVYLDRETGINAAAIQNRCLMIECSTIDIDDTIEIGQTMMQGNSTFVDATVSGGAWGAREGQLTFMVGHPSSSQKRERRSCPYYLWRESTTKFDSAVRWAWVRWPRSHITMYVLSTYSQRPKEWL